MKTTSQCFVQMGRAICMFILLFCSVQAISQTNAGKDFWVVQTPNGKSARTDTAQFAISVSNQGSQPATVIITNPVKPTITRTLAAGALEMFFFPTENPNIIPAVNPNASNVSTNVYKNNVYHVTSNENVIVYSFNPFYNVITNDAALVLPTHGLGKQYRAISYIHPLGGSGNSYFDVVASQDNTTVKTYNRAGTLVDNVVINKGECFQRLNGNALASDVTGWFIEADKPVGVLSGTQFTGVGNSNGASDHLDEQIVPIESLSKTYIASPTNARPLNCAYGNCAQDVFRYVATEDNTVITTSPNVGGGVLVKKGDFLEITTSTPHVVSGNKSFYGFQYIVSQNSGTPVAGIGDPALMAMPVIDQFQYRYSYVVPSSFPSNFINVVAPAGTKLNLDGVIISPNWITAGTVNGVLYKAATIATSAGVHNISADKKMGLVTTGFGSVASYGYMGGSGLQPINAGCISGGPYQALTCGNKSVGVKLNASPTCSDGSAPAKILWTSDKGNVVFSDSSIANPVATVSGPGIYYITLSVTCSDGNTTTCSTEIIVREPLEGCANITLPVLQVPAMIVVPSDSLMNYASNVNLGSPVYTATEPVSVINNAIAKYPNGNTIITWTLTDGNGITVSDTQRVVVVPPPTILAPSNITLTNDPGKSYSTAILTDTATYISNWGPNVLSHNAPAQLPDGSTTVTWTVKDGLGQTASATQVVTVISALPTITAPPAITVTAGYNGLATINTFGDASYTVSVNDATVSNSAEAGKVDYAPGTYTITWTVKDGLGRTATASQVITVEAPLPVITAPADTTVNNEQGFPYATGVTFPEPVFSAVGPYTLTNDAPAQLPLGETVITWTLTDAYGKTITTTSKVTVVSAAPSITAPGAITIVADYNGFATAPNLGTPTTTVSIDPATVTTTGTLAQYPIGTTFVEWTVKDGIGREASDVQKVVVTVPAPQITSPADITISNDPGQPYSTQVVLVDPAFQAVGPYTLKNDAPAEFPVGTTTVTWTLTDAHGNSTTTTTTVTVVSAAPTIVAPATITVDAIAGQNYAVINNIGTATYTVSVDPATLTNNAPANNQYQVGTTTITWTVKDGLGRSVSAIQQIIVKENYPPVVSGPVPDNGNITKNGCSYVATANDNALATVNGTPVTATYVLTGATTGTGTSLAGKTFNAGVTLVTWTAVSNGQTVTYKYTVTVADNNAPVIAGPVSGTMITQNPVAPALDFTVFTQKNATLIGSKTMGPVAIGGDMTLAGNYEVSNNYKGTFKVSNVPVTLVVGGKVNFQSGNMNVNQNGYVKIGTANGAYAWYKDQNNAYSPIRITPNNNYNASPRINLQVSANNINVSATNNPVFESGLIDFDAAFTKMKASAVSMSTGSDNVILKNYSNVILAHTNLPSQVRVELPNAVNYLNVKGTDLVNVQEITFTNQPSASRILVINVDAIGTYNWKAYNHNGLSDENAKYVIYNFYNATALNIQGSGNVHGTIFAPCADITKSSNQTILKGQIIGQTFYHSGGDISPSHFNATLTSGSTTVIANGSNVNRDVTAGCTYVVNGTEFNTTATDNCGTPSLTYTLSGATTGTGTNLAGVALNAGVTTISWKASDGVNTSTYSFTVNVADKIAPVVKTQNVTVSLSSNGTATVTAAQVNNGSSDNCGIANISLSKTSFNGTNLGDNTVTLTVTDNAGNISTGTAIVTVVSPAPTIVAPPSVTVTAGYNGFATVLSLGTPTTTVAVDPATVTNTGTLSQYPVGTTNITWTVKDGINRTASDVQQVIVVAPLPKLNTLSDITVSNNPGVAYATITLVAPTYDAVGPVTLTNNAPAQFPIGTTIVTWTLTDKYGKTTTVTQKVIVVSAAPTIVPPADVTVTTAPGATSATVTIGTATYTVSVNPATLTNNAPANNVYPVGTTLVVWTVKDGLGRTISGTQTIIVKAAPACNFATSIVSIPTDNTPTGGNANNLYVGYGAQSTKLQVNVPNTGGPYTFQWTGTGLNNNTSAAPIFTPGTSAGNYTFTVAVKNANGCTSTATISICVRDVRSLDKNGKWDGKKVIVCHLPPGNPANVQYIDVSVNAVPTHVPNHGGDGLGNSCVQPSCNSPYARGVAPTVETFGVSLYPNPTANQFSLTVKSDDKFTDINIRIIDAFGRTVEVMKGVMAGRTVLFGEKYANGAYYAEVIQGSDKKIIPMVKAK